MKRLILAAIITISGAVGSVNTACGQDFYGNGYGLGLGANQAFPFPGQNAWAGFSTREEPPYFAKFPPVYYSHIVRRPYGVSPYAAPPGIAPVEMQAQYQPVPEVIVNPYFAPDAPANSEAIAPDAPTPDSLKAPGPTAAVPMVPDSRPILPPVIQADDAAAQATETESVLSEAAAEKKQKQAALRNKAAEERKAAQRKAAENKKKAEQKAKQRKRAAEQKQATENKKAGEQKKAAEQKKAGKQKKAGERKQNGEKKQSTDLNQDQAQRDNNINLNSDSSAKF